MKSKRKDIAAEDISATPETDDLAATEKFTHAPDESTETTSRSGTAPTKIGAHRGADYEPLKTFVDFMTRWHDSYSKIIRFIGAIEVGILLFTTGFLFKEAMSGALAGTIAPGDLDVIMNAVVLIGLSLFFVFVAMIAEYNWYAEGIAWAVSKVDIDLRDLGDHLRYRRIYGPMRFWGVAAVALGLVAGVLLVIAMFLYFNAVLTVLDKALG